MHVLISGNPVDGLEFTGPYTTPEAAIDDAEQLSADWWIAELRDPTKRAPLRVFYENHHDRSRYEVEAMSVRVHNKNVWYTAPNGRRHALGLVENSYLSVEKN